MEHLRKNERRYVTSTLNPKQNPMVERLIHQADIVVADVDFTLIDFDKGHRAGQQAIADVLGQTIADQVDRMFHLMLEGHRKSSNVPWDDRHAYHNLVADMMTLQRGSSALSPLKAFSRETWIIIAAENLNVALEKGEVEHARDRYWDVLTKKSSMYPDAGELIKEIERKKIPLILMSGSDSIMVINNDLTLRYDPQVSEAYKQKRLQSLPFSYKEAIIGDPIDKPDTRFFDRVFESVQDELAYRPASEKILVVGDSERNDLEVPHDHGCKTLLIKRD